jgi:aminopeptidase N
MRIHLLALILLTSAVSQAATRADSLRGGNGPGRRNWDVRSYQLKFFIDTLNRQVSGNNQIIFINNAPVDSMQIDLQGEMRIGTAELDGVASVFRKEENVTWIYPPSKLKNGSHNLRLTFSGKPRTAVNPPWDGGFIWAKDSSGYPWISVACQGLGASAWWPCKDDQSDEPEDGVSVKFEGMPGMEIISNGRYQLAKQGAATSPQKGKKSQWKISNPINLYDICFYAGNYAHWQDTARGEAGVLTLDFYPLQINESIAKAHWAMVRDMIHCFERWMGPYPFYEDGYKLVEAPFLGMEHQSAVAYGNSYRMGYRGRDRSATGQGLYFDFITVHESAHEWFGNSVTAKDIAENWIHEGFATYAETIYTECIRGRDAAFSYARGEWRNIQNDRPVVGELGVNDEGSSDKYDKGSAMIHMIRIMLHDDGKFRNLLRGISKTFYHQTIEGKKLEAYISKETKMDLGLFFQQYLHTTDPPVVELRGTGPMVTASFKSSVAGLKIPIYNQYGKYVFTLSSKPAQIPVLEVSALRNYYFKYALEEGAVAPTP